MAPGGTIRQCAARHGCPGRTILAAASPAAGRCRGGRSSTFLRWSATYCRCCRNPDHCCRGRRIRTRTLLARGTQTRSSHRSRAGSSSSGSTTSRLHRCRSELRSCSSHSAVLSLRSIVDAAGVPHERQDALAQLHSAAIAPNFGLYESELGKGIVGGPYSSQRIRGEHIATATLRALHIPIDFQPQVDIIGSEAPVYDWCDEAGGTSTAGGFRPAVMSGTNLRRSGRSTKSPSSRRRPRCSCRRR